MSGNAVYFIQISPMPTPIRANNNWKKFCALPESAVIPLHIIKEIVIIFFRLPLSASLAMGIPKET